MKKQNQWIAGLTCFLFTVAVVGAGPGVGTAYAGAGDVSKPGPQVTSTVEPLPWIIIGALVLFAGIIVYDVIAHPYVEKNKKDDKDKKKHIHFQKQSQVENGNTPPKLTYSTDYDLLLGISHPQSTQQLVGKQLKEKSHP